MDAEIGHNSSTVNAAQLLAYVERIERVNESITDLNTDKKEIYGEAKANGWDAKILKKVVAIRAQDRDKRQEEEAILDLYLSALGLS
jgi:uncharacterized protein (UPF0335 family)